MSAQPSSVRPGPRSPAPTSGPVAAQPRRLSRVALVLWLIAIGLGILFVPLYLAGVTIRDEAARLETDLESVQATLSTVPTPLPEIQALLTTLSAVEAQVDQVESIAPTLEAGHIQWPAVMAAIGSYDPGQIDLTSVTQAGKQLTLVGRSASDAAVVNYASSLEQSALFSRVVVQSIRLVATPVVTPSATSVVTATATLTSTATVTPTATPTPTPNPRDQYEPDDTQPKVIALGESQTHNFFPGGDVDSASFLAKSGRYYRIYTADLSPGVDTLLSVNASGSAYTNDDVRPGTLSSEIAFQNLTGVDALAVIKVTNRGSFGPDQRYQLVVEEIVPTLTPTPNPTTPPTQGPTSTPPPTHTPTSTPTPTASPTQTPTSTPDLRDVYEPDELTPKPIAVGETQTHNFHPDADTDKVTYIAKAGRRYQVLTSDLVVGVDTYLVVSAGGQQWENDDYSPPGSGNFASAVCFEAPLDGDVQVTVTNVARQYGPAKTYKVTVNEVPDLNTPPCAATPLADTSARAPGLAALSLARQDSNPVSAPLPGPPASTAWLSPVLPNNAWRPALQAQTVEFVIVVEIRTASP